ncbi:MAG: primosomal protein N' [Candidatus Gastranaerophilales bacterium]|nr:primosomal protein N' [Candidatus Gastranaerophilales bacterium]
MRQNEVQTKYALVLVNIKGLGVKTFSYLIPDEIKEKIQIGQAVLVPFGRQGLINAFIVGFSDYLAEHIKAKKINKILDEKPLFTLEYLKLLEWVANYYACDFVTVLNMAIPLKLIDKNSKTEKIVEFLSNVPLAPILSRKGRGGINRQTEILELLKKQGKMSLIEFEKFAKTTRATINKLEALGCIKISDEEIYRNPLENLNVCEKEDLYELSDEQEKVYKALKKARGQEGKRASKQKACLPAFLPSCPQLIHGVTASGKTEVYFKLIQDTINQGKNVLFLAPEIALASQLTKRLARKFGTKDVAIWHSSISEGERYDVWQKLYKDEIKILAGARSAVFAPLKNIGLIIIDEEHENAYKQTNPTPRYDARTVAQKLAEFHNCPLILGSATPDVATYYKAVNSENLFELPNRFNNAQIAKTSVINMQNNSKQAYRGVISVQLQKAIEETLEKNQQVILLINRRGFSTYTQCQACGTVIECEDCSIPMIWHSDTRELKCHYCNRTKSFPDTCPHCESDTLSNSGTGTQKIEILIKELFKNARIERIDSDILTKKNAHVELLDKFQQGEIDILIGTQMIAKGLDNPNVTLVGVISADASFNMPDFRASERGFQLLTQVAGRSGRGEFSGSVIFQTYNPDFYALESAKAQNYKNFYKTEIQAREEFDYPPFSQVVRLILSSENNFRAEKSAQEIALRLSTMIDKHGLSERLIVLGPSTCVIEKIKGMYRFQILVKNKL